MSQEAEKQGMKFSTKLGLYAVGALLVLSFILSFGIIGIVVAGALAVGFFALRAKAAERGKAGMAADLARATVRWSVYVFRCEAQAVSGAFRSPRGKAVLFGLGGLVALTMVVSGKVAVPIVGFPGILLVGFVCGRGEIKGWQKWRENTERTLEAVVPSYALTADGRRKTRFGRTTFAKRLGTFDGFYEFELDLPKQVRAAQVFDLQEHLRERLRAHENVSWGFDVDLSKDYLRARAIKNLPTSLTMREEYFGDLDKATRDASGFVSNLDEEHASKDPATFIPIGKALEEPISWDLSNLFGCMLVVGAPGGGKSCAIRTIFFHTLRYRDSWDVYGLDMKRVELGPLRKYPNVVKVATRIEDAQEVLERVHAEMMHRYDLMEEEGVANIADLNPIFKRRTGQPPLKRVMVFIDEIAELVAEVGDEHDDIRKSLKGTIDSLVRLGRAAGCHLVLATQRPDATFISGATKSNIGARLAMGSLSANGSMMALEQTPRFSGISGRGWWFRQGRPLTQAQVYYTSTEDLDRLLEEEPVLAA